MFLLLAALVLNAAAFTVDAAPDEAPAPLVKSVRLDEAAPDRLHVEPEKENAAALIGNAAPDRAENVAPDEYAARIAALDEYAARIAADVERYRNAARLILIINAITFVGCIYSAVCTTMKVHESY